ncbi:spore germination protein [Paenibacillus ehimensis]|uniref:spore germination protein n=1 Tax=Paenibacillus ehimensis TaxID=79264 RepID=UPI000470196C|nr:spore germination protein [Paenibacillus ehimensis]MEC0212900.1 spore germination protein [Paenibacillus ehimensis]
MNIPTTNVRYRQIASELSEPGDIRSLHLSNGKTTIELFYLATLCDEAKIQSSVILPFIDGTDGKAWASRFTSLPGVRDVTGQPGAARMLLYGHALIYWGPFVFAFDANLVLNDKPLQSSIETSIQGPQSSLSENNGTNLNLIRHQYASPSLHVEYHQVGRVSPREIILLYDDAYCKRETIELIRRRLSEVRVNLVQSAGQLQIHMTNRTHLLFPSMLLTERPDRIAASLSQGKAVILLQGSPISLIAPTTFFDQLSAMDDIYNPYWFTTFLIFLRYISLLLTIVLPALYVAIVSYNPEVFRIQLAFTIAGSRAVVPYPSFVEVMLMLFMIEALVEGSMRLPKSIGQTATTVGGLILGQAAQEAGLVSSIMIIVTSVVAICNFIIPINTLSYSIRFLKYPLILFATFLGFVGVVGGLFLYVILLSNHRSFGEPYFKLPGIVRVKSSSS